MVVPDTAPAPNEPEGLPYKALARYHDDYDAKLWSKLWQLYRGGYEVLEHAREYIKQAPGESTERYEYRLTYASYICYFGQIVDYLVGALFTEDLQVAPAGDAKDPTTVGDYPDKAFYPLFAADADREETSFGEIIRKAVTEALICRRALVAVDLPPATTDAVNRANEEAAGAGRAYCFEVELAQLINWKRGEQGAFDWAVLHRRIQDRDSPYRDSQTYRERFKVWTMSEGRAYFEIWETPELKEDEEPSDDTALTLVTEGTTSFERIPVAVLELPWGLWAGNKIGPLAEEHFRRRSDLLGSLGQNLVEIPYVKLGPEISGVGEALPPEVQQDPHRGEDPVGRYRRQGYVELGHQDELGFAGPSGAAHEMADKGCQDTRDEIFATVAAMALSLPRSAVALARSGESKKEDRRAAEAVLGYLAELVRKFAVRVYRLVSQGRAEDRVVWVAHGLSRYELGDDPEMIEEAEGVKTLDIPSPTFKKEYWGRVALRLVPHASPETKAQIKDEIATGLEEREHEAALLREQLTRGGGFGGGEQDDSEDDESEEQSAAPPQ